jgi:hypothetical protein
MAWFSTALGRGFFHVWFGLAGFGSLLTNFAQIGSGPGPETQLSQRL